MNKTKAMFIFIIVLKVLEGFSLCPSIQVGNYIYPLQSFKGKDNKQAILQNSIIQISMCQALSCNNDNSYIVKRENQLCTPYTSQYPPIQNNYKNIDQNEPSKGLIVEYFPYTFSNNETDPNSTLESRITSIYVYCNLEKTEKTKCQQNANHQLKCFLYDEAGCPTLKVNSFWQFLINNSIVFAIIIWIIAIFQLIFGYLAIRLTIFIYGLLTGSFFGVILVAMNYVDFILENNSIFIFVICLSVLLGISFGIFLLTLPRMGYFNIGIWVALVISLLLQNAVYFLTGSLLAFYITFGVLAFIMGLISLLKFKFYVIVSSAITSSFWIIRALGFFLPNYPNQFFSSGNFLINKSTPWQFYLYLVSIVVLSILGIVLQVILSNKFGKGKKGTYYLENDDTIRQKIGKILQFGEVKEMLKAGKQQIVFLKNLVVDSDEEQQLSQLEMIDMKRNSDENHMKKKKKT